MQRFLRSLAIAAVIIFFSLNANISSAGEYDAIRAANKGRKAEIENFLLTTEQAVIYAFGGLTRYESVIDILDKLEKNNMRATFFVNDREIKTSIKAIDEIHRRGQELAIAIYNRKGGSFDEITGEITRVRSFLQERYGLSPTIARCIYGAETDELKEAVSAMGCRLVGRTVNVVQSRHKSAKSAEEVMKEIFGPAVLSLGRGQIVYIRTDFYDAPKLAGDVMLAIWREKIDNIAYRTFDDSPEINPHNDSSYYVASIGDILAKKDKLWNYVELDDMAPEFLPRHKTISSEAEFRAEFLKRYIGAFDIDENDRMLGFKYGDMLKCDKTGIIKTVTDNTIFLTFDDWGNDFSINKLLYVLRKHKTKGTFFIITWNMPNNPNLLRAIAEEGHNIASHTNAHSPMAFRVDKFGDITHDGSGKMTYSMPADIYAEDVAASYEKLARVTADVIVDGKHSLTRYFRPPTLAVSRRGVQSILEAGFTYLVSGNASTHDYASTSLTELINNLNAGIYHLDPAEKTKVKYQPRPGSILVMHMTHHAKFTPRALDLILGENEKRSFDDPLKFNCGLLSDYLVDDYDQQKSVKNEKTNINTGREKEKRAAANENYRRSTSK